MKDSAENERLQKTVTQDFQYLGGTTEERAEMLKSIEAMPEGSKTRILEILQKNNKANKPFFKNSGYTDRPEGGESQTATQEWEELLKSTMEKNKLGRSEAFKKCRQENRELYVKTRTEANEASGVSN